MTRMSQVPISFAAAFACSGLVISTSWRVIFTSGNSEATIFFVSSKRGSRRARTAIDDAPAAHGTWRRKTVLIDGPVVYALMNLMRVQAHSEDFFDEGAASTLESLSPEKGCIAPASH